MKNKKLMVLAMTSVLVTPAVVVPMNVSAEVVQTASISDFKDVTKSHPYYSIINEMREKGIITGYDNGTFKPDAKISRQHAAVLIQRVTTLSPKVSAKAYNDIPATHLYYDAIKQIQQAGIINADSKGNFNPMKDLTRGEMALILANAFNLEAKKQHQFKDVSKTSEEGKAIAALYEAGITTGYDDGTFKPNESLSRAHYAVFLYRSLNYKKEEEQVSTELPTLSMDMSFEDFKKIVANDKSLYNIDPNHISSNPVELTFKNERFRKMLVEGADVIRNTDYQFKSVGSYIMLEKPNFINILPEGYMSTQVSISKGNRDDMTIHVDYTDKENVEMAKQFLSISYPELAKQFDEIIDEKSTVARELYAVEKDVPDGQRTFQGNLDNFSTNEFNLKIGVNGFMWYLIIQIRSK